MKHLLGAFIIYNIFLTAQPEADKKDRKAGAKNAEMITVA